MDQLLQYDSCSSSSSSSSIIQTRKRKRQPASDNVNVLTNDEQNALIQHHAHNTGGAGSGGYCEEGSSDFDGQECPREGETDIVDNTCNGKRNRPDGLSTSQVVIAGDSDSSDNPDTNHLHAFERSNAHWEGRWTGHLFLPLPPLNQLDALDETSSRNEEPAHEVASDLDGNSDDDTIGSEEALSESRAFLPALRVIIRYWAVVLQESFHHDKSNDKECNNDGTTITIVPHIPMKNDSMRTPGTTLPDMERVSDQERKDLVTQNGSLHISLSRPIYLPAPSVDSFLQSIAKCINTILSPSTLYANTTQRGKIFHLRPHEAAIFTNDQQNRSFLTIPIAGQNAQWIKRALLPPIDATMKKFGLESYYSEKGESCVLHVSVASVKGNMMKRMLDARCSAGKYDASDMRSIALFPSKHSLSDGAKSEMDYVLKSIPMSIPIRLDTVQCQFGKAKEVTIKF
jgi:hypothetical protein